MARFIFKLEPVLNHRRHIEEQRQRELAMLLRQRVILQTQLRSMQERIGEDKREMADSLVGHVDVRRIRQHAAHVARVLLRMQQIAAELFGLSRKIDSARAILSEAVKARKAIEVLKDRRHVRWQHEEKRRETADLDELATGAFTRKLQETVV